MPDNNSALDEAIQRVGWTPEELASALNARLRDVGLARHQVHPKTPWKWIRRAERPHSPLPAYVAEVLSEQLGRTVTPDDLGLSSRKRAALSVPADDGLALPFSPDGARSAVAELLRRGPTDNRRMLPLRGPALSQHAHLWLVARMRDEEVTLAAGPDGSAPSTLKALRLLLDELRRIDDVEGGSPVEQWAAREAAWSADLLAQGRYGHRYERDLYQIFAELAQLAGWGAMDAGKHAEAQRWHLIALHAAESTGDSEFMAYILCMLAFDASLAGQNDQAIVILDSAQQGLRNRASLTVQSMLAGWQARAYAGAGDRKAFEKTLSRASMLYERARKEDAPEWAYWMVDPAQLGETARSWAMVGDPKRSIALLEPILPGLQAEYPRDFALHKAYLAEAQLLSDPSEAARTGVQALDALQGVDSPRTLDVVRSLSGRLAGVDTSAVRRLRDRLDS